jgi:membrane fusion protein (multidrug efflux system)
MRMATRTERKPSTTKRMIVMLIAVGLLLFLLVGWNVMGKIGMKKFMESMTEPPQTVTTTKVGFQEWQPAQAAVGSLRAVRGADLAFEVSGVVTKVNLKSGGEVREGDVLVQLRDTDDVAQLRQYEAAAALAEVTFARAKQQLAAQAISKADYDTAAADLKAKQAAVQQQQAVIAKKQLRAPFGGRAGIVTISPGAFVNAGTPIVTVQQVDPVYVDFYVPQRNLGELAVGQRVALTLDAFAGKAFEGTLSAINPKVDGDTRNVQVEASVANPERLLVPGMFANVSVDIGKKSRQLTLPQTAVTFNPYGETVFVVKPSGKKDDKGKDLPPVAQQAFITTGARRGDQVAIASGLEEGVEVVTSGQLKLKNGTPLIVDNSVPPPNDPNPKPQEK